MENFLLMLYFVVMTDAGEGSQTGKEKTEKQKTSNSDEEGAKTSHLWMIIQQLESRI